MRVPSADWSPERLLQLYGLYHLSRLRAHEEIADLAETFEQAQISLKAKVEALTAAGAKAITTLAVRDDKDDDLDDAVRSLFFDLLHRVLNDRNHPTFLRYFPKGLTPIVGLTPEEEIRAVGILLTRLADEEEPEIKAHAEPIQRALEDLETAKQAYEEEVDAERLARREMREEKGRWIDAYTRSHRALQLRFFKDSRRVERYFRSPRREPTPEIPPETSEDTERTVDTSEAGSEVTEVTEA